MPVRQACGGDPWARRHPDRITHTHGLPFIPVEQDLHIDREVFPMDVVDNLVGGSAMSMVLGLELLFILNGSVFPVLILVRVPDQRFTFNSFSSVSQNRLGRKAFQACLNATIFSKIILKLAQKITIVSRRKTVWVLKFWEPLMRGRITGQVSKVEVQLMIQLSKSVLIKWGR